MNVLIYGGSFDPVHKGHYALLKAAIKQLQTNESLGDNTRQRLVEPHK
jgi:cytidyltransferase-like protein